MVNIIYIRKSPEGLFDGTANYCNALYQFFKDEQDIHALPIVNYSAKKSKLLKYYYKKKDLISAISQADIIHINGYTAWGTAQALYYAKKLNKKVVYTAHWHPFQYLKHPFLGLLFFNIVLKPLIRKCADSVIAINNEDYKFFNGFHNDVYKIPHWYKLSGKINTIPKKKNMILFVGRIDDPVKHIETLYSIPEGKYEIHCVGKGTLRNRKDIHQHTNISNEELWKLYTESSLTVIPSKYEAFSYVALESLSHGTPVVMSDRVRIADHLQGLKGYSIFKYDDFNDFNQKIDKTIGITVDKDAIIELFSPQIIKNLYKIIYSK